MMMMMILMMIVYSSGGEAIYHFNHRASHESALAGND